MAHKKQTVDVTWSIACKIWWWIFWRAFLSAVAGGFILGFILGLIGILVGLGGESIQLFAMFFGGVLGIILNIYFIKKVIGKEFNNSTLVLLNNEFTKIDSEETEP
jgi:hypothetical protein